MRARTSSGSACSEAAVKPTRSQKRTVTTLRSSSAGRRLAERRAALVAELRALGVLRAAGRADGHGRSLGWHDEDLQSQRRPRVGSHGRARGLADQGRLGRRARRRRADRREHVRGRAWRQAGAVPYAPRERGVAHRPARRADAPHARGRTATARGRCGCLPARQGGRAPDPQRHGRAHPRAHALDADRARHRRVPRHRQDRRAQRRRRPDPVRPPGPELEYWEDED